MDGKSVTRGGGSPNVERVQSFTAEAQFLLEEYCSTVGVVVRDGPEGMRALLNDPRNGMWIAWKDEMPAGCVVLRAGVPFTEAVECKRLYVRTEFRKQGVADALMDALERFAAALGSGWVYLDTHDSFAASVRLYQGRGYQPCQGITTTHRRPCFSARTCCFREKLKRAG